MIYVISMLLSSLGLMVFFLRGYLPRIKDGAYLINLNDKQTNKQKNKKQIAFHNLLIKKLLYTFILLELNIFHKDC